MGMAMPRRRILVVDDDPSLVSMLRILLEYSGYDVQTAVNGREALRLTETTSFDLILLDLEMPVMNGREFFGAYRTRNQDTPIVIFSAYEPEAARVALGAQGSMAKPFDPSDLVRQLETLLQGGASGYRR
jgi:two-component system alkaline phosphatase synthesis response regulator PhoP